MTKKRGHTATEYTERDVLMGRGKRVSEWPGNIFFRQVINKHREKYIQAARSAKVKIAELVMEEIEQVGGRFLREFAEGQWCEIERARAVEKTCQALREKEKANPPNYDPFRDPNRKTKLAPSTGGGRRRRGSDYDSDEDDMSITDSEGSDLETDTEDDEDDNSSAPPKKKRSKAGTPSLEDSPVLRLRTVPEEDMFRKLHAFKRCYGHCAVPPGWPKDVTLADWCTAQRQAYREIQSFREASENEAMVIERLKDLEFVWDYFEWHWKDRLEKLKDVQKGTYEPNYKPQDVLNWLKDQRRQVRAELHELPDEYTRELQKLGVKL